MGTGYCPYCNKNVFTERDMDTGLIVFLLCCCGGVPGLICLAVGLSKPENICTLCHGTTHPPQMSTTTPVKQIEKISDPRLEIQKTKIFCKHCGEEISSDQKFCQGCGAEI